MQWISVSKSKTNCRNLIDTLYNQLQGRKTSHKVKYINILRNAKDMADQLQPIANAIDCC